MLKNGIIFVVSGASGCGKTTICRRISSEDPHVHYSISLTTRRMRKNEKDGVDYFFLTDEEFENRKSELIEYAEVYEHKYGTSSKIINSYLEDGNDVIMDIDTVGALNVKKSAYDSVLIYLLPPNIETLKKRLYGRNTDSLDVIEKRFNLALSEMIQMKEYDYLVVNDNLEIAIDKVKAIIEAERVKKSRILPHIQDVFK